jgi:succinoglycan biosynthesis transport protein ExoP
MNATRRLPAPNPFDDPFASPSGDQHTNESPLVVFQRLHRLLRGRYWIAFTLAALGAAAGAIGGWMATVPKYQSVGSIRILSNLPVKIYTDAINQQMIDLNAQVQTQANLIKDPRVIDMAMSSTAWKGLNRGLDPEAREHFRDSLVVSTSRDEPGWIRVKFLDPDPKAAQIAVEEVIMAYVDTWGKEEMIVTPELIEELNILRQRHARDAQTIDQDIQGKLIRWHGVDPAVLQKARLEEMTELDRKIRALDEQITQGSMEAAKSGDPSAPPQMDPIVAASEIAKADPLMRALLDEYNFAAGDVARFKAAGATERNPSLARAQRNLEAAKLRISEGVENYIANNGGMVAGGAFMGPISPAVIETMKATLETYKKRYDDLKAILTDLSRDAHYVAQRQEELRRKREEHDAVAKRITILTTESDSDETKSNRIKIVNTGEQPVAPYVDNRKKLAAMGVFFGGGFPFAMIMLLGLIDGRFRYSDQASTGKRHVPLLGILPYLPARMHDPEQAAVAAHCVHQVRTLLQISGQMHDRRVFTVTSPTAGDGKTSLSLSLGLSFAAAGSETCLIDFDMIGGGLTSGMQAKSDSGLMDAIDAGTLDGFVKPTSFPRLSILPIGRDDAREVSRLSPIAVRKIIEQAKKRFETVVIDTGPILGSIEASLACAAADGVILALGRGQQRSHADRAIEYLHTLGANLLGIVFNRAQAQDFKRSVSSASVRSVPMLENGSSGNGHASKLRALPALGPMASTVATAIRDDRHDGHDEGDERDDR